MKKILLYTVHQSYLISSYNFYFSYCYLPLKERERAIDFSNLKIYTTVYFRFWSCLWSVTYVIDTYDSVYPRARNPTVLQDPSDTCLRAYARNIFTEKAIVSARSNPARGIRNQVNEQWSHLDDGWFADITTRITLAYVNAPAHVQSLARMHSRTHARIHDACIFTCYICATLLRFSLSRQRESKEGKKGAWKIQSLL